MGPPAPLVGVVRLVLASTSRYRRALIQRLGVEVTCVAAACDEEALKRGLDHLPVPQRAVSLARAKAESVARLFPDALIIGSDQIAELDGEALDKPGTPARAVAQLARLSGRAHRLHTAVAVHHAPSGRTEVELEGHTLTLRALSRAAIERYVARDAPLDCCGSYRVESLGIALFEGIEGADPTAIEGLPLMRLTALLADFGVDVLG
ncbi:MAG: nucleoside triphosphate pyrophosphatase [Polyangiales bacterium]